MICRSSETFYCNSLAKKYPSQTIVFPRKLLQFGITISFFKKVIYQNEISDVVFDFVFQDLVEQCGARQCKMFKR